MTELGEPVTALGTAAPYTPSSIVPGRPGYVAPTWNGEPHQSSPAEPVEFLDPPPLL
jgi:hypothetical protein